MNKLEELLEKVAMQLPGFGSDEHGIYLEVLKRKLLPLLEAGEALFNDCERAEQHGNLCPDIQLGTYRAALKAALEGK